MINLKDNIWIEGFGNNQVAFEAFEKMTELANGTIYAGETYNLPEELAMECTRDIILSTGVFYINYRKMAALKDHIENRSVWHNQIVWEPMCKTAKESILTACDKPYCIIFKK